MSSWQDFDMSLIVTESTGMDSFLSDDMEEGMDIFEANTFKVATMEGLKGFSRIANSNTLIRTCEKDLWSLKEGEDGTFTVERLFDDDGNPLKA